MRQSGTKPRPADNVIALPVAVVGIVGDVGDVGVSQALSMRFAIAAVSGYVTEA